MSVAEKPLASDAASGSSIIQLGDSTVKDADDKSFQAREFAELTGVTVRTLHHYDRLDLFKPSRYSRAGYRLYRASDVTRLEQIVALKVIGFSLEEIKNILSRNSIDLATALRRQREALTEKTKRLELAIQAIERAEYVIGASREPGWEMFIKIIEVINMQQDMSWTKKYYSEDAQREIEKRAVTIPREVIEQGQRDWAVLIKEVDAAVTSGVDPQVSWRKDWRFVGLNYSKGSPAVIRRYKRALTRCTLTDQAGRHRCRSPSAMKFKLSSLKR